MKTKSLLALALVIPFTLLGGESSLWPPFWNRFSAVQISVGNHLLMNYPWTLEEFLPLAEGSDLLKNHSFDDYTYSSGFGMYPHRSNSTVVSASLVAPLGSKEEGHGGELRAGLRYHAGNSRSLEMSRRVSLLTDTLYTSQGGYFGTIETVENDRYLLTYSSNQLILDISMVFSTAARHRVTLYGGVGLAAGFSLSSYATVEHRNNIYNLLQTKRDNVFSTYHLWVADQFHREKISAPGNAGATLFLPAGLSVQPLKKGGAGERVHFFYEIQPGIQLTRITGHTTYFSSGTEHRVGVKLSR